MKKLVMAILSGIFLISLTMAQDRNNNITEQGRRKAGIYGEVKEEAENIPVREIKKLDRRAKEKIKRYSYMGEDEIKDIKEIYEELPNLEVLILDGSIIRNFEYVENLEKLKELNIQFSTIIDSDLEKLSKDGRLINLRLLNFRGVKGIKNLNILKKSLKLEVLNITDLESIESINEIEGFTELREVSLSGNKIEDISVLKSSRKIQLLGLDGNNITDIGVLNELRKIEYITVQDNPIKDFSPIRNLSGLKYLEINPVKSKEEVRHILPERLYEKGRLSNDENYNGRASGISY